MGIFKKCPCFCTGRRNRSDTNLVDEDSVKELDYSHCCLEDVPPNIFSHERTLEIINLESNQIRDLPRVNKA